MLQTFKALVESSGSSEEIATLLFHSVSQYLDSEAKRARLSPGESPESHWGEANKYQFFATEALLNAERKRCKSLQEENDLLHIRYHMNDAPTNDTKLKKNIALSDLVSVPSKSRLPVAHSVSLHNSGSCFNISRTSRRSVTVVLDDTVDAANRSASQEELRIYNAALQHQADIMTKTMHEFQQVLEFYRQRHNKMQQLLIRANEHCLQSEDALSSLKMEMQHIKEEHAKSDILMQMNMEALRQKIIDLEESILADGELNGKTKANHQQKLEEMQKRFAEEKKDLLKKIQLSASDASVHSTLDNVRDSFMRSDNIDSSMIISRLECGTTEGALFGALQDKCSKVPQLEATVEESRRQSAICLQSSDILCTVQMRDDNTREGNDGGRMVLPQLRIRNGSMGAPGASEEKKTEQLLKLPSPGTRVVKKKIMHWEQKLADVGYR